jgi:hypothetical protein
LHRDDTVMRGDRMHSADMTLATVRFSHATQHLIDVLAAARERGLVALLALNALAHGDLQEAERGVEAAAIR